MYTSKDVDSTNLRLLNRGLNLKLPKLRPKNTCEFLVVGNNDDKKFSLAILNV